MCVGVHMCVCVCTCCLCMYGCVHVYVCMHMNVCVCTYEVSTYWHTNYWYHTRSNYHNPESSSQPLSAWPVTSARTVERVQQTLSKVQYQQLIDIPRPISSYCFYKDICPSPNLYPNLLQLPILHLYATFALDYIFTDQSDHTETIRFKFSHNSVG